MLTFACVFGRHTPAPGEIRNQGFAFTRCRRCRRDLVRAGSTSRTVPKGFRIVWRPGKRAQAEQNTAQMLLGAPPAPGRGLTVIEPNRGWRAMPTLVGLAGAGLRLLLWRLADRRRDRRKLKLIRTSATIRVLRLPAG